MPWNVYTVERASTDELPPRERAEFWREHITAHQCDLDYRFSGPGFSGTTVHQRSAAYQLVEFRSDAISYLRTPAHIRRAPDEDYRLVIPFAGGMTVRQHDRWSRLTPGTGALVTLAEPLELRQASDTHGLVLTIPARQVDEPLGRSTPPALQLNLRVGLGRVVADLLKGLARERHTLTGPQFDAACDRLVELLCLISTGDERSDAPARLAELSALVRRYVRAHAADPDLNGTTIALDLGWSLRQIQLALQHAGTTPRDLIREERLRLARRLLQDPSHAHLPITDLAYAAGFSSPSALSTAFRHRYGTTPREARRSAALPVLGKGG
ncbi:helix-turn-helix domain-containing protein [Actinocorallia populi]|uniref:helix-turn-helix domain-containing protein n=1 Tax=Actinocorallia populi TaxID=2079200 RepID=UPI000D09124E|nr:helix-turn-helix domain-containing protein [Actinocorallia populi]